MHDISQAFTGLCQSRSPGPHPHLIIKVTVPTSYQCHLGVVTSESWHGAALGLGSPEPPSSTECPELVVCQFHGAYHQCLPGPGGCLGPRALWTGVSLPGLPFSLLAYAQRPHLTLLFSLGSWGKFCPTSRGILLPPNSEAPLRGSSSEAVLSWARRGGRGMGVMPDPQRELPHAHYSMGGSVS